MFQSASRVLRGAPLKGFLNRPHASAQAHTMSNFFSQTRPGSMLKTRLLLQGQQRHYYQGHYYQPYQAFRSTQLAYRTLLGINTAVFGTWLYATYITQDGRLQRLWQDNFLLSLPAIDAQRYWTLLTSTFAHMNLLHFAFNMMAMQAFSLTMITAGGIGIGATNFFALALGSGIAGSIAFLYQQKQRSAKGAWKWGPFAERGVTYITSALGASGTVMGLSMAAACLTPFARISIIVFPVPMWLATAIYVSVDLYLLDSEQSRVGHSAHLGGAAFGFMYYLLSLRRFGGISRLLSRGPRY